MSKQTIHIGDKANDGKGDTLRQAWSKQNSNNDELYARTLPRGYGSLEYSGAAAQQLSVVDVDGNSVDWQSFDFPPVVGSIYKDSPSITTDKTGAVKAVINRAGSYNFRIYVDVVPAGTTMKVGAECLVALFQSNAANPDKPWSAVEAYTLGRRQPSGEGTMLIDANIYVLEADVPVTLEAKWQANAEMMNKGTADSIGVEAMILTVREHPDNEDLVETIIT